MRAFAYGMIIASKPFVDSQTLIEDGGLGDPDLEMVGVFFMLRPKVLLTFTIPLPIFEDKFTIYH